MAQNMYKIRDIETGLYSAGGNPPRWSRTGKAWKSKSDLMRHFQLVMDDRKALINNYYSNAVIESYKVEHIEDIDSQFFITKARQKLKEKAREEQQRKEEREFRQKWEQYQRLKQEFEDK